MIEIYYLLVYRMSASFLRRHQRFLFNVTSASGLLTLGDFIAQTVYEKKKSLDNNRLCMIIIVLYFVGSFYF
jgi:hypothetical protein